MLVEVDTSVHHFCLDIWQVFRKPFEFPVDLVCKFSRVAEDKGIDGWVLWVGFNLLQSRDDEDGGLSHTGLGLDDHVLTNQ